MWGEAGSGPETGIVGYIEGDNVGNIVGDIAGVFLGPCQGPLQWEKLSLVRWGEQLWTDVGQTLFSVSLLQLTNPVCRPRGVFSGFLASFLLFQNFLPAGGGTEHPEAPAKQNSTPAYLSCSFLQPTAHEGVVHRASSTTQRPLLILDY